MPDQPRVILVVAEVAGGIAVHVTQLALGLKGLDVDVTVIAPTRSLAALTPLDGVTVIVAPVGSLRPWAWWSVRRQLRRLAGPGAVVHAHGLRAGASAAGATRGARLVVTWHNAALGSRVRRSVHAALERRVARRADVTLAASGDLAARARRAGAGDVRSVLVGSLTVAPARSRDEVRASLGVPAPAELVLAVARLHPQKRLDVLVDAAASWNRSGDAPREVIVAGDGPLHAELSEQIACTHAPVTLLGARHDVADLLAAADVAVLTSEWEARSLAAQEALRAGVPLVCTPVGGLPDLVGDAAVLVPVGDASALRAALDRVLGDDDLRAELIRRGRERAAEWPTSQQAAADMRSLYLDVMSS
ncbi:MAG TPA: glycosyltransferase family 4 protein [Mycobacteriales bacterium]|nr:glycosyltransferase family 4 protein [Mycobacteriales bacterium]